ncbi:hypothetical protein L593_12185 [Salinarchaeum sp. Harcht-Bsk1]|uniref:helix-turn-helix transcriptional regulator n=1 Tax=Salinarchaeum sp. Harcht-Bsk1 TaxID=1333523 RepID=UPI0003422CA7|nr:hypothetical protein [Salinarchaeum sp. Harcht-Bsk1]AGN02380.1 hypothetical protein L593_12185 [Salinarchaeum sp. Harcht-Bsk1]
MDRPEWILVLAILSVGLVGATVPAAAGIVDADSGVGGAVESIGSTHTAISQEEQAVGTSTLLAPLRWLPQQRDQFLATAQQQFERSTFRVRVRSDGDARWVFRYERPIETDDERSAFERYADRFRTEETDLYREFQNRSASLTAHASELTGRPMTARNVSRDAGIAQTPTQEEGYVELAFEWTNFGRVSGEEVVVGDVFEGGLYLGETQSLIFVAGEGVEFTSVHPDGSPSNATLADSRSVTWTGEHQFADRHPRAVFQIPQPVASGSGDDGASMLWLLGGGVIGLLLVTLLAITRYGGIPRREESTASAAAEAPATPTEADTVEEGAEDAAPSATADPAAVPEEPISDDRRVQQLLEDGGGRMKQTAIVEETDWSKSKVSMLLSEMEEDGRIKKIQVGRENIIALAGHEPEAASSPFDDAE